MVCWISSVSNYRNITQNTSIDNKAEYEYMNI